MPFMHCPVICHKLSISVSVYEKITESSFVAIKINFHFNIILNLSPTKPY